MFNDLKRKWCELRNGRPGHRFQEGAKRSRRARACQSWAERFLPPMIGIILFAGGIILCFMPGPGIPLLILGAAMLAERSITIARLLDWLEVRLRRVINRGRTWWRHA